MLHVVTVHWLDDRWIEPQLRFLRKNASDDGCHVYAALNGIDRDFRSKFFYADDLPGTHPEKLNRLAEIVREHASPEDLLLFVDGDAFPIAPVTDEVLAGHDLAAVRRDENANSPQPHPCFCLTTVGFWFAIAGDWRPGYKWRAENGDMITDAGGELLGILAERKIPWRPLLRSNRWNLDPLLYAVYGDVAYHHGAGFRPPVTYRVTLPSRDKVRAATASAIIPQRVPLLGRLERSVRYRRVRRKEDRRMAEYLDATQEQSDQVFEWIQHDDDFYRRFLGQSRES
jgi:hypothetical protein